MSSIYDKQSIPSPLHAKMKELAKLNNRPIIREYEEALEQWIAQQKQDIILADSKLDKIVLERLMLMEERLNGIIEDRVIPLQARYGMDTAIVLMGVLRLLSNIENHKGNESDPYGVNEIYNSLRPVASKYFSRPLKEHRKE